MCKTNILGLFEDNLELVKVLKKVWRPQHFFRGCPILLCHNGDLLCVTIFVFHSAYMLIPLFFLTQCVKVNEALGESCEILMSVSQGTVLGPLLFTLFVNDLLNSMPDGIIISLADDIATYLLVQIGLE